MAHVCHSTFWYDEENDIGYNSGGLYLFRGKHVTCLDWKWSEKIVELGGVACNKLDCNKTFVAIADDPNDYEILHYFIDFHLTFHIVKEEWLIECIEAREIVPFKKEHIWYSPMNTRRYWLDYCARTGTSTYRTNLEFNQPMCSFLLEGMKEQEEEKNRREGNAE